MQIHRVAIPVLVIAAAALVRWPGLWTDLWLDELWARRMAIAMPSAFTTFTLHHEVNHHLTTLWFYLTGPEASAQIYRLPSYVCGVGTVAAAGLIGWRRSGLRPGSGRPEPQSRGGATAIFAMLLTASSYELIVFSSEARGYSMAVFATLLSFLLLDLHFERARTWTLAAYAIVATAGLFTQPVFSTVLASSCVWSAVRWWRSRPRSMRSAGVALAPHILPLAAFAALYFGDLNHVVSGGGTGTSSLADAYRLSLAWTLGAPENVTLTWTAAAIAAAAILMGLRSVASSDFGAASFFLCAIVVFPNLALFLRGSEMVYTRHFLTGSTLTLVLIAVVLGSLWKRGRLWQLAAVAALVVFAATNALHVRSFVERGRGNYQQALRFMADRTAGPVTVAADHDFRVGLELDYYLKRVLGSRPAAFVPQGAWPKGGPAWVVANADHYEAPILPHNVYADPDGNEYELFRTVPTAPLTGLHWFLFRNRSPR